jgi:hypothetical protein
MTEPCCETPTHVPYTCGLLKCISCGKERSEVPVLASESDVPVTCCGDPDIVVCKAEGAQVCRNCGTEVAESCMEVNEFHDNQRTDPFGGCKPVAKFMASKWNHKRRTFQDNISMILTELMHSHNVSEVNKDAAMQLLTTIEKNVPAKQRSGMWRGKTMQSTACALLYRALKTTANAITLQHACDMAGGDRLEKAPRKAFFKRFCKVVTFVEDRSPVMEQALNPATQVARNVRRLGLPFKVVKVAESIVRENAEMPLHLPNLVGSSILLACKKLGIQGDVDVLASVFGHRPKTLEETSSRLLFTSIDLPSPTPLSLAPVQS